MSQPKAYKGSEPYIFISYAHADSERVFPIITALQERGYRVWYDAGIEAGTEWPEYIAEHLDGCAAFLAFISEGSMNSHNCRREINFAIELRKEPMVIYLEDVKMSLGMRMQLGSLQAMFRNRHSTQTSFLDELCGSQVLDECRQVTPPAQEEAPKAAPQNDFMTQQAEAFFQFGKDYYGRFNKEWKLKDESDFTKAVDWLTKAADLGHAQSMLYLGNCYYYVESYKNHETAVSWFRKAADLGFAKGENNLGVCYLNGKGVEEDKAEAFRLFRKAAEKDYAMAQFNVGRCYYFGWGVTEDEREAVKWFEKAAEQGHEGAAKRLGDCYAFENPAEALKWYLKAAEQGNKAAQYELGRYYEEGIGVPADEDEAIRWYQKAGMENCLSALAEKNYDKGVEHYNKNEYAEAVKYFRRAAELGNRDAQNYLGVLYQGGLGVGQSWDEAAKWYRKAADQGDQYGQYNLAICYRAGLSVEADDEEAKKWYRKAAEQGHLEAQKDLYLMLEYVDDAEASKWCRMAAEQNDAEAQYHMGMFCEQGRGVPFHPAGAVKWYTKAAEQGNQYAQFDLGRCMITGVGCTPDFLGGMEWLKKSARQGYQRAVDTLGQMGATY